MVANARYENLWLSYFDLMGFKKLVQKHQDLIEYVLLIYEDVLKAIEQNVGFKQKYGISYSWFSDTFIIYSQSDSNQDFALVEQASRHFFQKLILHYIPVRGAMTIGKLYSQREKNIFLGEALIDAYEYGEKQNWLGFILTPNIFRRFENTELSLTRRLHYREVDIPGVITHSEPDNVYAFAFSNSDINGENIYLEALSEMKIEAGNLYADKYNNTEKFIRGSHIIRP
ncbi:MAG: hypothetical protein HZB61_07470 [Nitrospirae bacterium]|nr:hypothetical protein [Nitrospirota bacterium]